jgi:hypothetical protein
MGLIAVLVSRLRMLLCSIGLLPALGMIALAVMLGGGAMRLGGVLVVLGSLVVFVFGHFSPHGLSAPSRRQIAHLNFCSTDVMKSFRVNFTGQRDRMRLLSIRPRLLGEADTD